MDLKLVKIASIREHMDAHYRGEISYSKAVDLINEDVNKELRIGGVSHSMTGDGMNSLEFFDMIKKEWCRGEEQYKPFWNDVLTFARKYHKELKEYCC